MTTKDEDKVEKTNGSDDATENEESKHSRGGDGDAKIASSDEDDDADDDVKSASSGDEDDDGDGDVKSASSGDGEAVADSDRGTSKSDHDEGHGHDDHDEDDDGHGLSHVTPVPLLGGVLAALLVLTVITVAATYVDLGKAGNLSVAMVIATIKAGLVVTFFMHLKWDRLFNTVVFLSSLLFLILFISLAITDRSEYDGDIQQFDFDKANQN